jgi:hypothetical protein
VTPPVPPSPARAAWRIARAHLLGLIRGRRLPNGKHRSQFAIIVWANMGLSLILTWGMAARIEPASFPAIWMSLGFFLVGATVAGDFAIGILEHPDADILSHLPISSPALLAGRLIEIGVVLAIVTGAFFVAPAFGGLAGISWNPAYPILFLVMGALQSAFVTLGVLGLYLLFLRWIHVERVKTIAAWLNGLVMAVLVLSYQAQAAWSAVDDIAGSARDTWVSFLVPPAWFSAPVEMLARGPSLLLAAQGAMALAVTVGLGFLVVRVLGRSYAERLGAGLVRKKLGTGRPRWRHLRFARAVLRVRPGAERAGFDLVLHHRKTIRPWLIAVIYCVMVVGMAWQGTGDPFGEKATALSFMSFFFQGMLAAIFLQLIMAAKVSADWKAAWILRALPAESPGAVWSGAKKAIVWMVTPVFAACFAGLAIAWRSPAHAAIYAAGAWLLGVLLLHLASPFLEGLPASEEPFTGKTKGWMIAFMMASQIGGIFFGLLQRLLFDLGPAVFGGAGIAFAGLVLIAGASSRKAGGRGGFLEES